MSNENLSGKGGQVGADWGKEHIDTLVQAIPQEYFKSKRWFGSKGRQIQNYELIDYALLQDQPVLTILVLLRFNYTDGNYELYHLPLLVRPTAQIPPATKAQPHGVAATLQTAEGEYAAYDAFTDENFCASLYHYIFEGRRIPTNEGSFIFSPIQGRLTASQANTTKLVSTEQSNTSMIFDSKFILKCFRKLAVGQNPDIEIPLFLTTRTEFKYTPSMTGYIEYDQHMGGVISIGSMQDFAQNKGDGYNFTLDMLRDYFKQLEPQVTGNQASVPDEQRNEQAAQLAQPYAEAARRLGQITAEMHNALASPAASEDIAFAPEAITATDVKRWEQSITGLIEQVLKTVTDQLQTYPERLRPQLQNIAAHQQDYLTLVQQLNALPPSGVNRIRYHGDYHLGQVLKTENDFIILDFEGEPARSLVERREKYCPLKDVTGMLRSFNYAAYAVLFEEQERLGAKANASELEKWAAAWEQVARQAFLEGYLEAAKRNTGAKYLPDSPQVLQQTLQVFEMEKAVYELNYEINNRPDWIPIPIKGLERIGQNLQEQS